MIVVAQIEYILRRELHVPARRAVHIKALEERLKMDGVAVWWLKIGVDNEHMTLQKVWTTMTSIWIAFLSSIAMALSVRAIHTVSMVNSKDTFAHDRDEQSGVGKQHNRTMCCCSWAYMYIYIDDILFYLRTMQPVVLIPHVEEHLPRVD